MNIKCYEIVGSRVELPLIYCADLPNEKKNKIESSYFLVIKVEYACCLPS